MPSTINRVPPGLLSLLDIKAQGENPRFLSDVVGPVFQFRDLYELQKTEARASAIVSVSATGFHVGIQVPESEYWHVLHHSVALASVGAGEIFDFCPYVFGWIFPGAYFEGPVGRPNRTTGQVGESLTGYADRDYWLGPGDQAGLRCNYLSGGAAVNCQTRLLIVRYPL